MSFVLSAKHTLFLYYSTKAIVHEFTPLDIKNIRAKIGMTQNEFASAFGISVSVSTLRHWERGDRTPHGPALVLLNVVAKEPQAVLNALSN
jgi:putative transcriptional regulator